MSEEIIQVGDGLISQIERATTDLDLSNTLSQLIDETNRVTGVPTEEYENNEGSSLSGEIFRMRDEERMEALASGSATVEQVLGIEQSEDSSPLSQEEEQILEQAVEEEHSEEDTVEGENTEVSANNSSTNTTQIHQEIPINSATLLVDEATSRFSSAIWYEKIQEKTIVLAGCGGIGSFVGFLLARMKPASMFLYDNDTVEAVNMSGQLYGQSDLGKYKVDALVEIIRNFANYGSIFAIPERFTSEPEASDIMICGFDNMEARRAFFTKWVEHVHSKPEEERANCLFIDGRLAAEEFQIFCIRGDDEFNINRYSHDFLFSDEEADETICSYKQTTFCANMIASYMVNLFVNFCANQCNPIIDRDLPFLTTYSAETMYLKTES